MAEPADAEDAGRAASGATAPAVAAASAAGLWEALTAALAPIIGARGVDALYRRSLYLSRSAHPCLEKAFEGTPLPGDFSGLRLALATVDGGAAAAAHAALIRTFRELLTTLIGASLVERLLAGVLPPLLHPGDAIVPESPP